MESPPFDRRDAAVLGVVVAILSGAYLFGGPAVQYAAWLTIFSIWMLWFVAFGVRWLYE